MAGVCLSATCGSCHQVEEAQSVGGDDTIDDWRVSLRHHDPQAGSTIENAEAGSAIEWKSRIVMSQTDKQPN
jgi:hypothetical protein